MSDVNDGLSSISYSINLLELRPLYTLIEITEKKCSEKKQPKLNSYREFPAANILYKDGNSFNAISVAKLFSRNLTA